MDPLSPSMIGVLKVLSGEGEDVAKFGNWEICEILCQYFGTKRVTCESTCRPVVGLIGCSMRATIFK